MLKCHICGKTRLFSCFTASGLCFRCETQIKVKTNTAINTIAQELEYMERCSTVKAKFSHIDKAEEALGILLVYQERGVPVKQFFSGKRKPDDWKNLLQEKRREVAENDEKNDERLKICPHCRGIQSKSVKRGRDCEICGKRIMVYHGELCSLEEYELNKQREIDTMKAERLNAQVNELEGMRKSGLIDRIRILVALDDRTCPNCRQLHHKKIPIEKASQYIPAQRCTSEYCRCAIVADFD